MPKNFLQAIVGDTERQVESKRVQEVVASGDVEHDLRRALEVRPSKPPTIVEMNPVLQSRGPADGLTSNALDDRSFDLVNITNWNEKIVWGPEEDAASPVVLAETNLTTPLNKTLESGAWTQSIIWGPHEPFRDFSQLELPEQDVVQEERPAGQCLRLCVLSIYTHQITVQEVARPRKRLRTDTQPKDKFNISNDQFYEVSKEGGRHRVRQTFGQLVVEHAYPAQKLQLPFVSSCDQISMDSIALLTYECSTRRGCPSKKHDPSTDQPFSSRPISRSVSARSAPRRRRKTEPGAKSARVATLAKVCIERAISACATRATSFSGSSLKNTHPSSPTLVWAVSWSTTIANRTRRMTIFPRSVSYSQSSGPHG